MNTYKTYKQRYLENYLELYLKPKLGIVDIYHQRLRMRLKENEMFVRDFFDSFKSTEFELKEIKSLYFHIHRENIVSILKKLVREIIEIEIIKKEYESLKERDFTGFPIFSVLEYDYHEHIIRFAFNPSVELFFKDLIDFENLKETMPQESQEKYKEIIKKAIKEIENETNEIKFKTTIFKEEE